MPDDFNTSHAPGVDIAAALRALPLETPERSAWPALAERLPQPRRPFTTWLVGGAVAAALALAIVLPLSQQPAAPEADLAAAPGGETAGLDALYEESARLEALLAVSADHSVASGSAAALANALSGRLQSIDLVLADPRTDAALRLPLWQQRVEVLRDLAALEGTRQILNAEGARLDGALAVAY